MLKLKCDDNLEKETFDVENSEKTMFEILFNTALLFNTMLLTIDLTGSILYSYFDKCLLDNVLDKWQWQWLTPHEDNQTIKNFKFSLEELLTALHLDDAFCSSKGMDDKCHEKAIHNESQGLWQQIQDIKLFQTLMPHNYEKDTVFTDTDLKALLFKSMPTTWQNSYLLKGTCTSGDFPKCYLTLFNYRVSHRPTGNFKIWCNFPKYRNQKLTQIYLY